MTLFRTSSYRAVLFSRFSVERLKAQQNGRAAGKMVTLQMPAIPEPGPRHP